jgi:hypothetical protein
MTLNTMWITAALACALAIATAAAAQTKGSAAGPQDAAEVLGRWRGSVVAPRGEMEIQVDLERGRQAKTITGSITNPHGSFTVTGAVKRAGRWTVSFMGDDGTKGEMVGSIKDGVFGGEWIFKPHAVGTFTLRRPKTTPLPR